MLWIAVPAYGIAGVLVRRSRNVEPPTTPEAIAAWIGAAVCTVALFAIEPVLGSRTSWGLRCLGRWGMAECVAFAGFLLFVGGGSAPGFFVFLVWSLTLHMITPPAEPSP